MLQSAIKLLHPLVRIPCRYIPSTRPILWHSLLEPKFSWRDHQVTARAQFGGRFHCNTKDVIQRYIYYFGTWEPVITGFIRNRLQPGNTLIDIGANIGYVSLLGAKAVGPKGRVVAIEASEKTFEALKANIELNRAANIRAIRGAVSEKEAKLIPHAGLGENGGMASTIWDFGGSSETVDAGPLSRWLTDAEISSARVIKIDVEGTEMSVLRSLTPLLGRFRFDVEIACEISPKIDREELHSTLKPFIDAEFGIFSVQADRIEHYFDHKPRSIAFRHDGRFCQDERTELIISRAMQDVLS